MRMTQRISVENKIIIACCITYFFALLLIILWQEISVQRTGFYWNIWKNIAICIQQNIANFVSNCLDSMRGTRNISVNLKATFSVCLYIILC